jgi:hypothetical protein
MFIPGQLTQVKQRSFIAFGSGTSITTAAQIPFVIPREARFISILLVGAGGGGGGGTTGAITTSRRGGGGGGSGGTSGALISTRTLPETIYLNLPGGGVGGNANSNGSASINAYISISPLRSSSPNHIILQAGAGNLGQVTGGGGAAVAASSLTTSNVCHVLFLGVSFAPGTAGQNSGTTGATAAQTISFCTSAGGCGGGSTNLGTPAAGGNLTVGSTTGANIFGFTASQIVIPGGAATGAAGANGFHNLENCMLYGDAATSLYSLPGSGGGAIDSGTGGRGGDGAPGCGGSGGGAGTTGGRGGDGGASFCSIEWW